MQKKGLQKKKEKVRKIIRTLKRLFPDAGMALNYKNNWELFVSVVLSAQCTDKKANEVTKDLFKKYRTLDDYVKTDVNEFGKDIRRVGLYRNKAKNILSAARIVKEKFGGKLPQTMFEMLILPGAGRKTANVVLGNAYNVVEGIAVDTHVRRLSLRLGLTKYADPKKIEQDLMQIVPRKDWFLFTYLMIEYGRKYCPARPHDHAKCPLSKL